VAPAAVVEGLDVADDVPVGTFLRGVLHAVDAPPSEPGILSRHLGQRYGMAPLTRPTGLRVLAPGVVLRPLRTPWPTWERSL
jgi:hypothetical protein